MAVNQRISDGKVCLKVGTKKMIVFVTKECTRDCAFCVDRRNAQYYKDRGLEGIYMESETLQRALEFAARNRIETVQLNGGEPTLHPDIVGFANKIKKAGFSTEVVTNCDFPEVVRSLDGIVDRIFVSYYAQDWLPRQDEFQSRVILRVALSKSLFPTLNTLITFLENNRERYSDIKITTLINNSKFSRSNQVDYIGELERLYPLYEEDNGKKYHDFMGYRIKRLDLENLSLDVQKTSYKVHVDGVISHYSEEDYYELGGLDPDSAVAKELRATRDPDRRAIIRGSYGG